jgi:sulfatase maturation enzyme AslB (radical SAM superfamily)
LDSVFNSEFNHLAIVGKEPLVSNSSISLLEKIVEKCIINDKTVSIVTNGSGLNYLPTNIINQLAYIDVSFDGGIDSYNKFRRGSFMEIIAAINMIQNQYDVTFNALHTITSENINHIDDMVSIRELARFQTIMLSSFLATEHYGVNNVSTISLVDLLLKLASSNSFMNSVEALLLIDIYHVQQDNVPIRTIKELIIKNKLQSKVALIEDDPIKHGIVRVTYDDYVLNPNESLHPRVYKDSKYLASKVNINSAFEELYNAYV